MDIFFEYLLCFEKNILKKFERKLLVKIEVMRYA